MSKYEELVGRYRDAWEKNYFALFSCFRPKINRNMRLALLGENRCCEAMEREKDLVEVMLKRIYTGDEINNLSLSEIISVKKGCEGAIKRLEDRKLKKEEYYSLVSTLRNFDNTDDAKLLKVLSQYE